MGVNEYIRRDAVLLIISDAPRLYLNDVVRADRISTAVKKLPAADVRENVRGEWVDDERRPMSDPRLQCSNCGSIEIPLVKWNYCPVCGAEMRGEKDV